MEAAVARSVDTVDSAGGAPNLSFAQARIAHRRLEGWLMSEEAKALKADQVEVEAQRQGQEMVRLMLKAHFRERGPGDVGPALVVHPTAGEAEAAPVVQRRRRVRERVLTTIVGEVPIERTAYSAAGRDSIHPLDQSAALPERSFSHPLQRRLVLKAVRGPFDEAVADVKESTGVTVSKRSIEQLTVDAAGDFDQFYQERTPPPAEKTGPILVATADGKGVPVVKPEKNLRCVRPGKGKKRNKKRMATVAAVFTQQPRVRTPEEVVESLFDETLKLVDPENPRPRPPGPEHKRVWASLEKSKEAVLAETAAEMKRRDPHGTKQAVIVTDGERALQRMLPAAVRAALGAVTVVVVLDLMHALERLWKAAYCFHPEGSDEAKAWVRERALRILRGQVGQVVKGLRQSATKRGFTGAKRRTIETVTGYLYRNRDRMRYHEYLRLGLPIASGSVEGACKNLVKDRMERSGMRWTIPGAEAMLKMRAVERSGDFDDYWEFHLRQEQARLHPAGQWSVAAK